MTSTKRILFVVFILIFLTGIAIGLIGRSICTRDNENYLNVQGTTLPLPMATVLSSSNVLAITLITILFRR